MHTGSEKTQRHLAGKSGLSPCPGKTTAVTEGGTGAWQSKVPQRAQRQCGVGRRALDSESEALSSSLSPAAHQR